jgi:hypothetical protein
MLTHQITVPVDETAREYLERRAEREGRSVASVVRRCIDAAQAHEESAAIAYRQRRGG